MICKIHKILIHKIHAILSNQLRIGEATISNTKKKRGKTILKFGHNC